MEVRKAKSQRLTLFVLIAGAVWVCLGGLVEAAREDLLESLIAKNEVAWQKIQAMSSIQYTLEREWLDRRSQKPFHGTVQIKRRGNCLWCVNRSTIRTGPLQVTGQTHIQAGNRTFVMQRAEPNTVGGRVEEAEQRLVVNDKYMAEWPVGNPFAYRWDHNSVETMTPRRKERVAMMARDDFSPACFGTDRYRFREAVRMNPDAVRYEAAQVKGTDGRVLYQIRRFYPKESPTADLISVIDPAKGYLAVESTFYAASETPIRQETMQVEEVAPGLWFPVACEEVRYVPSSQTAEPPAVEGWTKVALKDLKLNEPIPDTQFEIDTLRLAEVKPDVIVNWTTLDGQTRPHAYRDGQLVLHEIFSR